MELFAINCTTCQARLKVRVAAAIGQILACPKCGSMVHVAAPAGWRMPTASDVAAMAAAPAAASSGAGVVRDTASSGVTLRMPAPVFPPASAAPAPERVPEPASAAKSVATATAQAQPNDIPAFVPAAESFVARAMAGVRRQWLLVVCSPVAALAIALLAWIVLRPGQPIDESPATDSIAANTPVVAADSGANPPGAHSVQNPGADLTVDEANPPESPEAPAEIAAAPDEQPLEAGDGATKAGEAAPVDALAAKREEQQPGATDRAQPAQPQSPLDQPERGQPPADAPNTDASDKSPAVAEAARRTDSAQSADAKSETAARDEGPVAQETTPAVDVDARLADPLAGIEFKRVSLADFCDFLSRLTTIPITLDVDALSLAGRRVSDLVTIDAKDTTVGAALETVLTPRGLAYVVRDQQLVITTQAPAAEGVLEAKYDVSDLEAAGVDANRLAVLVARFVSPWSWQERGGTAGVKGAQGELIVEQTALEQRHAAAFLDKVRLARGLPAKGSLRPDEASLKSRYSRAKANLDKEVTANFSLETPLAEVLSWLGRATATRILIDEASLAEAGQSGRAPATLVADHQPLHEALVALLNPLSLTFRVVDEKTIQVFDNQLLAERVEFELYPVGDLLADGLDSKQMLAKLREHVDPASWTEGSGLGAMELDEASKYLFVVQSPAAQIRLENLLSRAKTGNRSRPK